MTGLGGLKPFSLVLGRVNESYIVDDQFAEIPPREGEVIVLVNAVRPIGTGALTVTVGHHLKGVAIPLLTFESHPAIGFISAKAAIPADKLGEDIYVTRVLDPDDLATSFDLSVILLVELKYREANPQPW